METIKQISEIIPQVLTEMNSLPILQENSEPMKSSEDAKREPQIIKPLATPWQRKHLRLECRTKETQEMATAAEKLIGRWVRNRTNGPNLLVISGPTGNGKTTTIERCIVVANTLSVPAWACGYWKEKPPLVYSTSWQTLCDKIETSGNSMIDIMQDCISANLLSIDDIGAESDRFRSGKFTDALAVLLNKRQKPKLWTMITTNIAPSGWRERWDRRIEDRLLRNSVVVNLETTPSYWQNL